MKVDGRKHAEKDESCFYPVWRCNCLDIRGPRPGFGRIASGTCLAAHAREGIVALVACTGPRELDGSVPIK